MPPVAASLPPLRIVLRGKYWDSQIYSGKLVLFGLDGSLIEIDWGRFVASLPLEETLRFVAEAALLGSNRFYSADIRRLIQDPEVKPVIESKFRRLQSTVEGWIFDVPGFSRSHDNPLPFPHNDSDFHYESLYVGALSGVFQLGNLRHRAQQLTDVPTLDIATKFSTIALAAGEEGLFEVKLSREHRGIMSSIAPNACNTCEWSYASIVCSQQAHSLFVAAFGWVRDEPRGTGSRRQKVRQFERVVSDEELFRSLDVDSKENIIQWGAKDAMYRYQDGKIERVRNASNGRASFESLGKIDVSEMLDLETFDLEQFVAVRVAPFGSVFEFDDKIVVLRNSGIPWTSYGEPVNWRVFPRSKNYLNHLHLIYEDRIEIISFIDDYFVPPSERLFGTEPISADEH